MSTATMSKEIMLVSDVLPPLVVETPEREVARLLDQLVREKGADYVYPYSNPDPEAENASNASNGDCMYVERVNPGTPPSEVFDWNTEGDSKLAPVEQLVPSCLLGHLAVRVGVPMTELVLQGNTDAWTALWPHLRSLPKRWHNVDLNFALNELQTAQDKGATWGEAVAEFKHKMGLA